MTATDQTSLPRTDLVCSPPRPDGTIIVYNPATERHLKLGGDAYLFLQSLAKERVASTLPVETQQRLLASFQDHDLIGSDSTHGRSTHGQDAHGQRATHLTFRRLSSIEFTIGDPSSLLARLRPTMTTLARYPLAALQIGLALVGLIAMLQAAATMNAAISRPPSLAVTVGALGLIITSMFVHELAHALVLTHYGGTVRRLGVMLLYLAPAMFCDVSDAWLLGTRRQRLRVATAGVEANLALASMASLGLMISGPPSSTATMLLTWTVLGNLALALINLNPFVSLDGYWILAIAIDDPNLKAGLHRRRSPVTGSQRRSVRLGWTAYALTSRAMTVFLLLSAIVWYWSLR